MKVLVLPRDANPYQSLLYGEMRRLGVQVIYLGELTPIQTLNLLLLPLEVAQIMRIEEREVRNMIRRGELQDVSSGSRRRLDPNEVIIVVEERVATGELSPHVFIELAALIAGRL